MRHIFLLAVMALSTVVFAQKNKVQLPELPMDEETGLISYSEVVTVDGASAPDLYDRAFDWGKNYYKNFGEKLRKEDKEGGRLEIFGRFTIYAHDNKGNVTTSKIGLIQYTLGIDLKDGRYRYTISEFNQKSGSYLACETWLDPEDVNMSNNAYKLMDIDSEMQSLLKDFKQAMSTAPAAKKDDW